MKVIKTSQAEISIYEDGFVDIRFTKNARITVCEQEEQYLSFKPYIEQSKGLVVLDPSNVIAYTKEARNFVTQDKIEEITKAAVILVTCPLSRMFANVFIKRTKTRFPMKSFKRRKEAIVWLKSI